MAHIRITASTGDVFGRLRVASEVFRDEKKRRVARCLCACGATKVVTLSDLVHGRVKSCGCAKAEQAKLLGESNRRHGETAGGRRSPTYITWQSMLLRCDNPATNGYANYGGRGIRVCDRWRGPEGFDCFLADMGHRPEGMSLDRVNNDGDYEPSNCLWASASVQRRNQRTARLVSFGGEVKTVGEWARELGIHRNTILRRLNRGASAEDALRR